MTCERLEYRIVPPRKLSLRERIKRAELEAKCSQDVARTSAIMARECFERLQRLQRDSALLDAEYGTEVI